MLKLSQKHNLLNLLNQDITRLAIFSQSESMGEYSLEDNS